jgi:hypothetical protein
MRYLRFTPKFGLQYSSSLWSYLCVGILMQVNFQDLYYFTGYRLDRKLTSRIYQF